MDQLTDGHFHKKPHVEPGDIRLGVLRRDYGNADDDYVDDDDEGKREDALKCEPLPPGHRDVP